MGWIDQVYMYGFLISVFLLAIVFTTAKNEVVTAIKIFWAKFRYKRRIAQLKFIQADKTIQTVYVGITKAHYEHQNEPFFINPLKAITEKGMNTFYFVNNNVSSHDFFNKPQDVVAKIIKEAKEKGIKEQQLKSEGKTVVDISDKFHNIFDEPYRFDATMMQEAMVKAQLGNQLTILDKLFKVITSKNLVTLFATIALASAAAALFGFLTFDAVSQAQLCAQVQPEGILTV